MSDWKIVPEAPSSDWKIVPDDATQAQPEGKPSVWERLKGGISTVGKGIGALGSTIASPLDTIRDPVKRRQLGRGFSDAVTFGIAEKAGERVEGQASGIVADKLAQYRQIAAKQPPAMRARMEEMIAEYEQEVAGDIGATGGWAGTREQDQAIAPEYRTGGQIVGSLIPTGGTGAVGRGGVALASKALGMVPAKGKLANAGMGVAKGLLGYQAAAPVTAAVQAAVAGDNPAEAAKQAATDPLGLILSAGGGAIAGTARGQAQRYRDPKTMEGRTVKGAERLGGKIHPTGRPVRGGVFDDPDVTSLPEGREGMNQLAVQKAESVKGYNAQKLKTERQSFGDQMDSVLAENADKHHLADKSHAVLDQLEKENTLRSGKPVNARMKSQLDELREQLSTETGQLDSAAAARGDAVRITAPAVIVEDMIKVKKSINDQAQWGQPSTVENRPFRLLANALREDAAAVDPRIAQMNKSYAQTMAGLEEANDILFAQKRAELKPTAPADKRAALKLGRIGDDTQAGTTDRLDRLRELDPQYGRELDALEAKKITERLRYGSPEVSTGLEKGVDNAGAAAARRGLMSMLGFNMGGPLGAIGGYAAGAATRNPLALRLRLGLPAADAIGTRGTGRTGFVFDRLSELQRQQDEKRKRN